MNNEVKSGRIAVPQMFNAQFVGRPQTTSKGAAARGQGN